MTAIEIIKRTIPLSIGMVILALLYRWWSATYVKNELYKGKVVKNNINFDGEFILYASTVEYCKEGSVFVFEDIGFSQDSLSVGDDVWVYHYRNKPYLFDPDRNKSGYAVLLTIGLLLIFSSVVAFLF